MARRFSTARAGRVLASALLLFFAIAPQPGRGQEGTEVTPEFTLELILVDSLQEATSIHNRLLNGEDFAALAFKHSTDPTANQGGYLGTMNPDDLRLELRNALQGIGPGQFTEVIKMPRGYALLKRLRNSERADAGESNETRLTEVNAQRSMRLTLDTSGYNELIDSIMFAIPSSRWGQDLKAVCETRKEAPQKGIEALHKQLELNGPTTDTANRITIHYTIASLLSSTGKIDDAIEEWQEAYRIAQAASMAPAVQSLEQALGVGYLHRASSPDGQSPDRPPSPIYEGNLVPTHPSPAQARPDDVEKAIEYLTKSLSYEPSNVELQWLLNLAYMTGGRYPDGVPAEFLIPPSVFASTEDVGHFPDIAPAVGLDILGTAGGAVIDDMDNDGLLDVVTSEIDDCAPMHYFHNNGDGSFTNRAEQSGLAEQTGGLNMNHADYNNDGCVDLLVLRGGWEFARRRSLLRNNCDGTFTDVTAQSGLAEPLRPTQSAAWVDIDNDGNLDLFSANEDMPAQLFLNLGDGTFFDIAKEAGVDRTEFSKAAVTADYDNDGYADIYVSNASGPGFLYHNNGDRTFTEVSDQAGVHSSPYSFSAWFFDYDNDGWPDLFVTSYFYSVEESVRSYLGMPRRGDTLKLFRNKQDGTFEDVTAEVGLDRVFMPMGCNFGDVDNDGFLDFYLGMGHPSFAAVLPNTLFRNQDGKHFTDISTSSGTGAIFKGHGVAFADLGNNGDEDLFIVMGGASIGDKNTARLFENPGGHGNDWITLKLVGETSNRSAIGARIAVTVVNAGAGRRTIYRTVSSGGSFGDSPLQQHIGLGKSASIENVEIWWPASNTRQTFTDLDPNQFLEIKESDPNPTKLDRPVFQLGGLARSLASAQSPGDK